MQVVGWFGVVDLDADGQSELVTIGDFQSHIDVLEFDPARPESERLSVKWRRDIEQDIERREKWPQVGPHPVIDVTGDGCPEIVLNLFNDTDGQWHAVVLDAASGRRSAIYRAVSCTEPVTSMRTAGRVRRWRRWTPGILRSDRVDRVAGFDAHRPLVELRILLVCGGPAQFDTTWSTTASQGMRHVVKVAIGIRSSS